CRSGFPSWRESTECGVDKAFRIRGINWFVRHETAEVERAADEVHEQVKVSRRVELATCDAAAQEVPQLLAARFADGAEQQRVQFRVRLLGGDQCGHRGAEGRFR